MLNKIFNKKLPTLEKKKEKYIFIKNTLISYSVDNCFIH